MNAEEVGRERPDDDAAAEQKLRDSEAAGHGGSIPRSADGVGIGASADANTFEPEEDQDAADDDG